MKSKNILATVVALFFFSIYTFASDYKTYTNEMVTDCGKLVEVTHFYKGSDTPVKRTMCKVDHEGNYLENTVYEWDSRKGWLEVRKTDYVYNANSELEAITTSKWDRWKKCWGLNPKTLHYTPNSNGGYDIAEVTNVKKR